MAGTLTGANIITRVQDTLQDTTSVRWSEAELLRYINDAQREIVNLRPESSADHANVQLVAGTEQTILNLLRSVWRPGGEQLVQLIARTTTSISENANSPNYEKT